MTDEDISRRTTPPETNEEWAYIWRGARLAHYAWVVVGPVHAFATNWRAIGMGAIVIVAINSPELVDLLRLWVWGE